MRTPFVLQTAYNAAQTAFDEFFENPGVFIADTRAPGNSLEESLERSISQLKLAVQKGTTHWVVTYSGGKDSTLLTVLACEIIRRNLPWKPKSIDIVYSDTLQEIPAMHNTALNFLSYIDLISREQGLPIHTHITHPEWHQTFWFLILGKGYPVPHRRFWWCTERLKINPVKKILKSLTEQDNTAVLTGVRFGESDRRDGKMKKAASCVGEGECGQVLEYQGAFAPIAHWKTCHVWDFLALCAPVWGWPTDDVVNLYGDAPVRFGCWTCTLVEKDRALETVIMKKGNGYLQGLARFRQRLLDVSADRSMRVIRPNGVPGKLKIGVRRMLLDELLSLQEEVGLQLIHSEEIKVIQEHWTKDEKGDSY